MEELKKTILSYLPYLGGAIVITIVGLLIAFIAVRVTRKAMTHKNADPSLTAFICKAIRIIIYVFTLIAAMSAMQISTAGLIAFFSAAAAAVALALKDRISDVASGIVILFTKPFVTGDFIEFGKYQGYVQKVNLMHTYLSTYDCTSVVVPNSVISSSEVNNHTSEPIVRVQVDVPIPYDCDISKVKDILFGVIKSTQLVVEDEKHIPSVSLMKFGESSLDFAVRVFCDFKDYWKVYFSLTEDIKKALDSSDISIPFNQLDVHIIDDK